MTKQVKKIAIFDVDGTIKDTFDSWAERAIDSIDKFAETRAKARGEKKEDVIKQVDKELQTISVMEWFSNFDYLPTNLESLKAKNPEEAKLFAKEDAKILHNATKHRLATTKAFKGVPQTLQKLKNSGSKVVFHTDATRMDVLTSFYQMGIPVNCVDAVYAVGDDSSKNKDIPLKVDSKAREYYEKLSEKMVDVDDHKPSPKTVNIILDRFGVKASEAVFVGDNKADALSCKPANVDFVWQKDGAKVNKEAEHFNNVRLKGGPRNYMIGLDITVEKLKQVAKDNNIKGIWPPDLSLEKGFKDNTLMNTYKFIAPEKAKESSKVIESAIKKAKKSR